MADGAAARGDGHPLRLVVAEDAGVVRAGLVRLLSDVGFDVVGEAADLDGLLAAVDAHRPDVALTDVRMPPTKADEGLRAAADIRRRHPGTGVLLFSAYVDPVAATDLVRGGGSGVGYLLKDRVADVDELADAIRTVAAGGLVVDAEVVGDLLATAATEDPITRLSPREREILGLMAQGRSNAAISRQLFISGKTLEHHITSVFAKLGLPPAVDDHRRVMAVLRYLRGA